MEGTNTVSIHKINPNIPKRFRRGQWYHIKYIQDYTNKKKEAIFQFTRRDRDIVYHSIWIHMWEGLEKYSNQFILDKKDIIKKVTEDYVNQVKSQIL